MVPSRSITSAAATSAPAAMRSVPSTTAIRARAAAAAILRHARSRNSASGGGSALSCAR
jgi:hypothetical protein